MSQSLTALYLQNPEMAQALRRQQFGQQMLAQGSDASPVQHPLQGLARVAQALMGGYLSGKADDEMTTAAEKRRAQDLELLGGGLGAPQPPAAPQPAPMTAPQQPVGQQFLPPTGVDPEEDLLVRTVYGEARGEPAQGQQAVAAVVRNRAKAAGVPVRDIVFAPGQFEPWGNPQTRAMLEKLDPASPEYQQILQNIRAGGDPTGGATHFYSPQAQAAAGRPAPAWATGTPTQIGGHNFYNLPYSYRGPAPQQDGDTIPAAAPGQPAPQGGMPQPRTPDGSQLYLQQAQEYQARAQRALAMGRPAIADFFMKQAQFAQQLALARQPQPDETQRLFDLAGIDPRSPDGQRLARQILERKGAPPTTTVNNNPENYAAKKAVDDWGTAKTAAMETSRRTTLFDTALSVLDNDAFSPGATAEVRLKLAQLGSALGLETNAPAGEVLKAVQRQLELANTPKGQGQITENERTLIRETLPVLSSTPEGVRMMIEATKLLDARDREVFKIYNDSAKRNGNVPNLAEVNDAILNLPPALPPAMIARLNQWKDAGTSPGGGDATPTTGPGGTAQGGGWSIRPKQ